MEGKGRGLKVDATKGFICNLSEERRGDGGRGKTRQRGSQVARQGMIRFKVTVCVERQEVGNTGVVVEREAGSGDSRWGEAVPGEAKIQVWPWKWPLVGGLKGLWRRRFQGTER